MKWDKIVFAALQRYSRAAFYLRVEFEDLRGTAYVSAYEAEASWDASKGRSLSSWVWLRVEYEIKNLLGRQPKIDFVEDDPDCFSNSPDIENFVIVKDLLNVLQAKITNTQWDLICQRYVLGMTGNELAEYYGVANHTIINWFYEMRKNIRMFS